MSGDGRNFHWTTQAAVSGTSLWLVTLLQCLSAMTDKSTASLNLTAPVNCHSQCLITALLLSAFNFVVIEGHRLCIEGTFSHLRWLKLLTFGFKALKHQPCCSCQEKHCLSCLRGEIILRCQQSKLHGSPLISDALCFKSDA